jgi:hypothetical protein
LAIAALKASSGAVEAYIAAVPEPAQTALVQLREVIRSAVPKEAVKVISYGIPAFALAKPFWLCSLQEPFNYKIDTAVRSYNKLQRRLQQNLTRKGKLIGPLATCRPGFRLALSLEIERYCSADEILQCRVIDLVAFVDVDGAPDIAVEA